jgi:hypothetical protein
MKRKSKVALAVAALAFAWLVWPAPHCYTVVRPARSWPRGYVVSIPSDGAFALRTSGLTGPVEYFDSAAGR